MPTPKDVVEMLMNQTKNGGIQWQPSVDGRAVTSWSVSHAGCRFSLLDSGALYLSARGQMVVIAHGRDVEELRNLLRTMFKGDILTTDEALKLAWDCLTT